MMVTSDALRAAGWRLTADHATSAYSVPVIVAPDGQAIGDGDLVRVRWDGALVEDTFGPGCLLQGRLLDGVTIREMLEECELMETYRYGRIAHNPDDPQSGYEVFAWATWWLAEDNTGVVACNASDTFAALWPDQFDGEQDEAIALDCEASDITSGIDGEVISVEEAWQRMGNQAREFACDLGWPVPEDPQ